jgi:hypothetical protein
MQNEYHNQSCFSSASKALLDKIYTCEELRKSGIDTSEYRFLDEIGDFRGVLVLKAEARNDNLRTFFDFEDGRKIITPVFWFQRSQGLWDIPVGSRLLLHYGLSSKGGIYLTHAEMMNEMGELR